MRASRIASVLLLVCALISTPLSPAFARTAIAEAPAHAAACATEHAIDAHAHHADVDDTAAGCVQDTCDSACCASCAHGFLVVAGIEPAGPARVSVLTATLPTGHITLIPALLERPPRFLA